MRPDPTRYRLDAGRPVRANPDASQILARVVGAIAATAALTLALFFGAIMFVALLGAAVIGTVAFRIWLWWQMRRVNIAGTGGPQRADRERPQWRAGREGSTRDASASRHRRDERYSGRTIIDGDYEVIDADDPRRPHRHGADRNND